MHKNKVEVYALCHPGSKRVEGFPSNNLLHVVYVDLSQLLDARSMLPEDIDTFIIWDGQVLLVMSGMTCTFKIIMLYMHWMR